MNVIDKPGVRVVDSEIGPCKGSANIVVGASDVTIGRLR